MTSKNNVMEALERCLDPDEYHTVARFHVHHPEDDFSIEFGTHTIDPPVWNVADHPPVDTSDFPSWVVRDTGTEYVMLESDASTAEEAFSELEELLVDAGADACSVAKTFAGAENPLKDLYDITQHYIIGPLRRVFGGGEA